MQLQVIASYMYVLEFANVKYKYELNIIYVASLKQNITCIPVMQAFIIKKILMMGSLQSDDCLHIATFFYISTAFLKLYTFYKVRIYTYSCYIIFLCPIQPLATA